MGRFLITGGAGFIGSHLCEALLQRGDRVTIIDNLSTGRFENVEHLTGNPQFGFAIDSILVQIGNNCRHITQDVLIINNDITGRCFFS